MEQKIKTKLYCDQCYADVKFVTEESGPHTKASCAVCGRYIKFLNPKERGIEMPELEMFFEFPDNKYGEGIMLEEYNDRLSLVFAQKPKSGNGTVYKKWCYPQGKDRGPLEKAIPWKIHIGRDRQEAIEMLRAIAIQLKGE